MRIKLNNKGFTLIEVMISMAIVGILLITLISFMTQSFTHIFSQGKRTKASFVAQNEMDNTLSDINYGDGKEDIVVESSNLFLTLKSESGSGSISSSPIPGKILRISIDDGSTRNIITFVPDK